MMDTNFQRAKSQENKNIRYQQIMDVTDELFHKTTYHDITLSVISKALQLARGGLYKYVTSKEEIFLMIYLQKEEAFIHEVLSLLKDQTVTTDIFIQVFSEVLYRHMDLLKYHQILNAIIETNVTVEKLAHFKLKSNEHIYALYPMIQDCVAIKQESWFNTYLTILYHGVYLYDRVAYHDNYVQAMTLAKLEIKDIDFTQQLSRFMKMVFEYHY